MKSDLPVTFLTWPQVIRFLFPYLRGYRLKLSLLMAVLLFGVGITYITPQVQRFFFDEVLLGKNRSAFLPLLLLLGVLFCLRQAIITGSNYWSNRIMAKIGLDVQSVFSGHLLRLPSHFFDASGSGYLSSRFSRDLQEMKVLYSPMIFNIIMNVLQFVGGAFFVFYFRWQLFVAALPAALLLYCCNRYFVRRQFEISCRQQEARACAGGKLQESLQNIRLVKASASEQKTHIELTGQFEEIYKLSLSNLKLATIRRSALHGVPGIFKGCLLALCAWYVVAGELTVGELVALNTYLSMMLSPAVAFSANENSLQQGRAAAARLKELIEQLPEEHLDAGREVARLTGEIQFDQVSFSYLPEKKVLDRVSFQLWPGSKTALVGPSGSGKSTIGALLIGLYQAESGKILLDHYPIEEFCLRSLRNRIGYVNTSAQLFNDTFAYNLRFGNPALSDAAIWSMLQRTCPDLCLEGAEATLRRKVGEGGTTLSAGQRLRLTITRELLRQPDILILDEPSSTLDNESERRLLRLLQQECSAITVLLITHRPALMAFADRILVLENGRLTGDGTRETLLAENEMFQSLYRNG